MQDWDAHILKIARDRRRIGDALKRVLDDVDDGVAPIAISLAISDAEKSVDSLRLIQNQNGHVFYSVRVLSSILGDTPAEVIEGWASTGENGFPPPARGTQPRDWLWCLGEVEVWLEDRRRSKEALER